MFSEKLKILRTEHKLSQQKLGEQLGMSQRRLSHLECGQTEPTVNDLAAICKLFNVSADYLIGIKEKN